MNHYRICALLTMLMSLGLGAEPALGQAFPGDTIRVSVRMPESSVYGRRTVVHFFGTFNAVFDDRLRIDVPTGRSLSFALDSVAGVYTRKARSPGAGALRGAGWGALSLGILGFVLGATSPMPDSGPLITEEINSGLMAGAVLAVPGALIGMAIGRSAPGSHWKRVPMDQLYVGRGQASNLVLGGAGDGNEMKRNP